MALLISDSASDAIDSSDRISPFMAPKQRRQTRADCSQFFVPVPSQQLKEPARVCRRCFGAMNGDILSLESMASDAESEINSAMEELVVA